METPEVLKKALEAQRYLSELKGIFQSIPNQEILLNTLPIQYFTRQSNGSESPTILYLESIPQTSPTPSPYD